MKFQFHNVQFTDINGEPIENQAIYKTLANALYFYAKNLDLVEIAMKINRSEEVELNDAQIKALKEVIEDPKVTMLAFAKKTLLDYIVKGEA